MPDTLSAHVEELVAIEEIRRLEARYAYYADHKRWDDLATLFTEDGWFRPLDVAGNEVSSMTGRADIAGQLSSRMTEDFLPLHQLFTNEIDIESSTTAKAVWSMTDVIFRTGSDTPAMRGWGHYHVSYRKEDGRWLIAARTLTRTRLELND